MAIFKIIDCFGQNVDIGVTFCEFLFDYKRNARDFTDHGFTTGEGLTAGFQTPEDLRAYREWFYQREMTAKGDSTVKSGDAALSGAFSDFETPTPALRNALEAVKAYAALFRPGSKPDYLLYIHGPEGSGKRHLTTALVIDATGPKSRQKIWCSPIGLTSSNGDADTYLGADLLVIDDLDVCCSVRGPYFSEEVFQMTPEQIKFAADIIMQRTEDGSPTVIASRRNPKELASALAETGAEKSAADLLNLITRRGVVVELECRPERKDGHG